ncbi:uncharacterized protein AKAME5_001918500 [Lates japonicus]|uniref:Immunoglobulin V-set domain-containing protein n=1 Tax=Lates japonicus TaxID=270547 RepID=A0AAD3REV5_LATJO|nr:uncharacterized protein AKAME5_001918500 [Lates japonicus]
MFSLSKGNYHVFCPTQQIKEQEGGVAKIQCHVDPSVNLEDYILYCTRADLNDEAVASLRYGKVDADPPMDQYRNTTTLTYDPISRNLTLLIFPLTLFHSGQYRCLAPKLTDSGTITLTVGTEKMNVGAIVGGVLGALIGLGLILIGVLVKLGIISK